MRHVQSIVSVLLSVVLSLGVLPGSLAQAMAAEPGGALAITSEPAGAVAYVDGEPVGETPLTLDGLLAGDHRIKVAAGGYLENSRVVAVAAGEGKTLHVRLTPDTSARPTIHAQAEPGAEPG